MTVFAAQFGAASRLSDTELYLVTGGKNDCGIAVWHYVRVLCSRRAAFLRAVASGNVMLGQYGEIAASGYGTTPPPHVQKRLQAG